MIRSKTFLLFAPLVYLCMCLFASSGHAQSKTSAPVFTRVTDGAIATDRANSNGAAWGDYDGDGDLDLFVANLDLAANFYYRNDGAGNLERVTEGAIATDRIFSRGVCSADFDNDDDLDLFVSGTGARMYVNDGTGAFSSADLATMFGTTDLRGWACAWADYDLDGFVDLFITHPANFAGTPATSNHFLRNRGDGTFEAVPSSPATLGLAPYTVATWSDYDLDGDPDLFIGAGPATGVLGPDFLYKNMKMETGTADLVRITDGPLATQNRDGQVFNWIDYDNDGDLDIYLTNWGGANGGLLNELYRNDDGVLTKVLQGSIVSDKQVSLASVWGDFDNDGDLDVYVSDGNSTRASRFYDNNGDGTFTKLIVGPILSDQSVSWGATAGDYDNDGDLDLFVANAFSGSTNFMYRNDQTTGNHWIKIKTVGTTSNRSGIGALVRAKATIGGVPTWMMREVSSQNSFNSHNDLAVHFGLGDATKIDSLTIRWPSGMEDAYVDVAVDAPMIATEGESLTSVAVEDDALPQGLSLSQNYPNPATDLTTIAFTLDRSENVRLTVHDLLGRAIATPVSSWMDAGRHQVDFDVAGLAGGTYVYRLQVGENVAQRMLVVSR